MRGKDGPEQTSSEGQRREQHGHGNKRASDHRARRVARAAAARRLRGRRARASAAHRAARRRRVQAGPVQAHGVPLEAVERLVRRPVHVDPADAADKARARVEEPERLVRPLGRDHHRELVARAAVRRDARARVEAVYGRLDVVRGDAGRVEERLVRRVVARGDCGQR